MADVTKKTKNLNLTMEFADGDNRVLAIDNPINDDDELVNKIGTLKTDMVANQPVLGDKKGAAFTGFSKAVVKEVTTTNFDLA